jgi:CRISPR-associated protein Csx17
LAAVSAFLAGDVNDSRVEAWTRATVLLDWSRVSKKIQHSAAPRVVPAAPYALVKLCHLVSPLREGQSITTDPAILARLHAGDGPGALMLASRRLRGNGWNVALNTAAVSAEQSARLAAALLFPLAQRDTQTLVHLITRPENIPHAYVQGDTP